MMEEIKSVSSVEIDVMPEQRRRRRCSLMTLLRPASGKRRVWDRVSTLERELSGTRSLSENLQQLLDLTTKELATVRAERDHLVSEVQTLTTALETAVESNVMNGMPISFSFSERPDEPQEQVTYPIPTGELFQVQGETNDVTSTQPLRRIMSDEAQYLNNTGSAWVVRPTRQTTLHTSMSVTGTYSVSTLGRSPFAVTDPAMFLRNRR